MITYTKRGYGFGLLFRAYGSAIPRSTPIALLSAALAVYLNLFHVDYVRSVWLNPFPYQLFGTIVGFIVVFRAQWAHERYLAGRDQMQTMTARWADACAQALSFDEHTPPPDAGEQWRRDADAFQRGLVHLTSLLHGLAMQHLRGDWDLNKLTTHDLASPPPPNDASDLKRQEYARNPMYDWFFIRAHHKQRDQYNNATPIAVIGGVTHSEQTVMQRRMDPRKAPQLRSRGWFSTKLSSGEYCAGAGERVNIVLGWIYARLSARRHAGGLAIDAPVLANVWARLADGYQAFEQCRMLVDTPFPFPWAQLLVLFLLGYAASLPWLVVAFVDHAWAAAALTFFAVLTYWSTNEVARDLEDPFAYDPNDLPTSRMAYLFNERLLQNAAGTLFDAPELPAVDIPAAASEVVGPSPQTPERRRHKARGDGGGVTEPLLSVPRDDGEDAGNQEQV